MLFYWNVSLQPCRRSWALLRRCSLRSALYFVCIHLCSNLPTNLPDHTSQHDGAITMFDCRDTGIYNNNYNGFLWEFCPNNSVLRILNGHPGAFWEAGYHVFLVMNVFRMSTLGCVSVMFSHLHKELWISLSLTICWWFPQGSPSPKFLATSRGLVRVSRLICFRGYCVLGFFKCFSVNLLSSHTCKIRWLAL